MFDGEIVEKYFPFKNILDLENFQSRTESKTRFKCKVQPCRALLGYLFCNTAAHTEATPTREGI